ncbi:unnamed protein product, partial [Cyprideis torosa]
KRKSDSFTEEFNKARTEALSGLQNKIFKAIKEVAEKENYDVVLSENVLYLGLEVRGNPDIRLTGVAHLQKAGTNDLSFLYQSSYIPYLESTGAGAVIVKSDQANQCPVTCLIADDPYLAYARAAQLLFPRKRGAGLRAPTAVIGDGCGIADTADVGANVVIGCNVEIGHEAIIGPGCVIEDNCSIGAGTYLKARVSLGEGTVLGEECLVHPGAVIGSDGFGFANNRGRWEKIPQVGRVIIGSFVDVGANTTIDRGTVGNTVIRDGVKLDNQIHIAHNVEGHFPGKPIMPGVLIMESLAQTCGLYAFSSHPASEQDKKYLYLFAGIDKARFRKAPKPMWMASWWHRLKSCALSRRWLLIDPRAIIDPAAKIGEGVSIGAFSIVGADVVIGDGCEIGPHVVINGPTRMGSENRVFQFASIGEQPQDLKYNGEPTELIIGDRNTFREFVTINRGTVTGYNKTQIGNDGLFMAYVHIAHDSLVGDRVVFSNGASLAGHVIVGDNVILSGFTLVHQFVSVGDHAFTGMGTALNRDLPPFTMAAGNYASAIGINKEGLKRRGFSPETIAALNKAFRLLIKGRDRKAALDKLAPLMVEFDD